LARFLPSASFLTLILALALAACDQAAPATCEHVCTTPEPSPEECAIDLSLSDDCVGHVELAEVAIDGCLEPTRLHPGEELVTCARIPVGGTFTWTVRSTEWQWGPWEDSCPKGGLKLPYALSCQ